MEEGMSTTILDSRELQELQPAHALWKQYVPEDALYHFRAKDLAQAEQWQKEARQALDKFRNREEEHSRTDNLPNENKEQKPGW